jgi:hypothetical protein
MPGKPSSKQPAPKVKPKSADEISALIRSGRVAEAVRRATRAASRKRF